MASGLHSSERARIVLTILARDEADIIGENIAYHLGHGIDWIIATDNGSTDGTREILEGFSRGGGLTLLHEPASDFSQHRWVTRMARLAFTHHGADWVINADADEFFVSRCGSLHEDLTRCADAADVVFAARTDFVSYDRPLRSAPPLEMVYRKQVSYNLAGHPLAPKAIHRGAPDVLVSQGNHEAASAQFRSARVESRIEVFHYPIRTGPQFERKVRNGGSGYEQNKELHPRIGFHKRYWYELLKRGELDSEYTRHTYSDGRLSEALARGELLEDRAVADWFSTRATRAAISSGSA